jgi:two-component sensor histidine kinase
VQKLQNELRDYNADDTGRAPTIKDSAKVNILIDLANEINLYNSEQAMLYLQQSVALAHKIKYRRRVGVAYNLMGSINDSNSDYKNALHYYHLAQQQYREIGNRIGEVDTYFNIGVVYGKQANYPEALKHMLKGLEMAKAENDEQGIISGFNNIGVFYIEQGKYDDALGSFLNALELLKKHDQLSYIEVISQNIGDIYLLKNNYPKALQYYEDGLKLSERAKNLQAESNNYHGIGRVYLQQKKFDKAIINLEKALKIRTGINSTYGIADSYITIGEVYLAAAEFTEADKNLRKGLQLVKKSGELELAQRAYQYLAEVHKSLGNYRLAYEYQTFFKQTTDSIFNIEKDKKLTELQMNYEFDKKQADLKAIQKEKDTANLQAANKQRNISFLIVAALLIVSAVAFSINRNLNKNKLQKKLIEEQNGQIQMSLLEKETLLREIHHRVKNNLQIISSLLNIQSEDIQDTKVLLSIQEGQSRVEAMSLIHQNLYQSEHLTHVDIENYIKELVQYLVKMYHGKEQNIDIAIFTNGLRFDVDTAIPMGLIVNELVSNAFKYAFDTHTTGRLEINIHAINEFEYELIVSNNGTPLPADFDLHRSKSLGLKLVSMLSRQLRGSFTVSCTGGITAFRVIFKDVKAWQALN